MLLSVLVSFHARLLASRDCPHRVGCRPRVHTPFCIVWPQHRITYFSFSSLTWSALTARTATRLLTRDSTNGGCNPAMQRCTTITNLFLFLRSGLPCRCQPCIVIVRFNLEKHLSISRMNGAALETHSVVRLLASYILSERKWIANRTTTLHLQGLLHSISTPRPCRLIVGLLARKSCSNIQLSLSILL